MPSQLTTVYADPVEPVRILLAQLQPRKIRGLAEFAEDEIILPSGRREGLPFRCATVPWTRALFAEMESPRWRRVFGRGSVQSGKTLLFVVIPVIYHLFEIGEDVIFGAPSIDLARSIWFDRVLPCIKRTRYYGLYYPKSGPGSRGGKVDALTMENGATVRFMGAGGGDAQRSSHTSRVVVLTELDKMDEPGEASDEADPIRQFEARTTSFGASAKIYGECTTSDEHGRIYVETTQLGTDTRIHLQCPHCLKYHYPERDHLSGWQDAETIVQASQSAAYACPHCGTCWTNADRAHAIAHTRLVHKGQTIDDAGNVAGPLPETYTLGVVWTAMHTPMLEISDIAEKEWTVSQSLDTESAMRELLQFWWAIPYRHDLKAPTMSYRHLAEHCGAYAYDPLAILPENAARGQTPPPSGIEFRTGVCDVQKNVLYTLVMGWSMQLTAWVLAFPVIEIVPEESHRDPTEFEVAAALDQAAELFDAYDCEIAAFDTGYKHEASSDRNIVRDWLLSQPAHYHALVGRAAGQINRIKITGKTLDLPPAAQSLDTWVQCRQQAAGDLIWFLNVDLIKDELWRRLFRLPGAEGYIHFPQDCANPDRTNRATGPGSCGWIFSHIMRCHPETITRNGRPVRIWKERGRHDLWDNLTYSLLFAHLLRADLADAQPAPKTAPVPVAENTSIRTRY